MRLLSEIQKFNRERWLVVIKKKKIPTGYKAGNSGVDWSRRGWKWREKEGEAISRACCKPSNLQRQGFTKSPFPHFLFSHLFHTSFFLYATFGTHRGLHCLKNPHLINFLSSTDIFGCGIWKSLSFFLPPPSLTSKCLFLRKNFSWRYLPQTLDLHISKENLGFANEMSLHKRASDFANNVDFSGLNEVI